MRLLVQRVKEARVMFESERHSEIGAGLLVFLGIHIDDTSKDIPWFVNKLVHLRIFPDIEGKMNRSVKEAGGQILLVSQFTLYGNCLSGRRPDFIQAAAPSVALPLYEQFLEKLRLEMGDIKTGVFGAKMEISLINDGPVTFLLEQEKK